MLASVSTRRGTKCIGVVVMQGGKGLRGKNVMSECFGATVSDMS